MRQWRGFTILELMMTLVVLGLLAALAVPSFSQMIARNNLAAASNDLVVALLSARSEAVKRECQVTVTSGSWANGWTSNVLSNISGCTAQEIVSHEVSSSNLTVTTNGNVGNTVTYDPEGRAVGLAGGDADYFELTLDGQTRFVCLTLFGRPFIPDRNLTVDQSGMGCS